MKIVLSVAVYALALLSIAAGIPKIIQMHQELEFLKAIGLSGLSVSALGFVQVSGGLLLLWKKYRVPGAVLTGLVLLVSSIAIFAAGNVQFGLISILPFLVSLFVIYGTATRDRHGHQQQ